MYKTYVKVNKLKIPTLPDVTFSFTMDKGEIICITGDNGSGKTSLGMYLAGFLRPQGMGQVIIDGLDPFSELDRDKLRRREDMFSRTLVMVLLLKTFSGI